MSSMIDFQLAETSMNDIGTTEKLLNSFVPDILLSILQSRHQFDKFSLLEPFSEKFWAVCLVVDIAGIVFLLSVKSNKFFCYN